MSDIWYERNPGRRPPYEDAILGDNEDDEVPDEDLPVGWIQGRNQLFGS